MNGSQRSNRSGLADDKYGKKEAKIYTTAASAAGFTSVSTSTAVTDLLGAIAQGTDISNRIGRRVRVRRIFCHAQIVGGQTNSVADDPWNAFRLTVVLAKPGFAPTWGVNGPIDARYSPANGLIRVLHDETKLICSQAKDSVGYLQAALEYEFDMSCEIPIEWS